MINDPAPCPGVAPSPEKESLSPISSICGLTRAARPIVKAMNTASKATVNTKLIMFCLLIYSYHPILMALIGLSSRFAASLLTISCATSRIKAVSSSVLACLRSIFSGFSAGSLL